MKALVIADNEKVIDNIGSVLEDFGYDVIVYRWLLKALDNIEEIAPHIIVISTEDYPRHWKTLAQFSASNSRVPPKLILYVGSTQAKLSEDEQKKADALNVSGSFSSENGFGELRDILSSIPSAAKKEPPHEDNAGEGAQNGAGGKEADGERAECPCSFVFTNPITLALVSGDARGYDGTKLEFSPDIPSLAANLPEATEIKAATIMVGDDIRHVSALVVSNDSSRLVLKITA